MNKAIRVAISALLSAAVLCAGAFSTWAADREASATLYLPAGDQAVIQFSDGKTSFFDFSGAVPGDTLKQHITIQNRRPESVKFYLNAINPTENDALLKQIRLKITNRTGTSDQVIYNGNLTGRPESAYGNYDLYKNSTTQINGINLGTYAANATVNLIAEVTVDLAVDNDFADDMSRVFWQVRAELPDPAAESSSSRSSSSSTGNRTGTTGRDRDLSRDTDNPYEITDNDIPLAGEPYKIADNQIPLAELPKTGGLPFFEMGIAAVCAGGGILLVGRKKQN